MNTKTNTLNPNTNYGFEQYLHESITAEFSGVENVDEIASTIVTNFKSWLYSSGIGPDAFAPLGTEAKSATGN